MGAVLAEEEAVVIASDEEIEHYGSWFVAMKLNAYGWTFEDYMNRVLKNRREKK